MTHRCRRYRRAVNQHANVRPAYVRPASMSTPTPTSTTPPESARTSTSTHTHTHARNHDHCHHPQIIPTDREVEDAEREANRAAVEQGTEAERTVSWASTNLQRTQFSTVTPSTTAGPPSLHTTGPPPLRTTTLLPFDLLKHRPPPYYCATTPPRPRTTRPLHQRPRPPTSRPAASPPNHPSASHEHRQVERGEGRTRALH